MKTKTRLIAFLLALVAIVSVFAVSVSAYDLTVGSYGTSYTNANTKTNNYRYSTVTVTSCSAGIPNPYLYFGVCINTVSSPSTNEKSCASSITLTYSSDPTLGKQYYLRGRNTRGETITASGNWIP